MLKLAQGRKGASKKLLISLTPVKEEYKDSMNKSIKLRFLLLKI